MSEVQRALWQQALLPGTRLALQYFGPSDMDWKITIADLHQYGEVTSPLEKIELYTSEYVPSGRECVPPQTA